MFLKTTSSEKTAGLVEHCSHLASLHPPDNLVVFPVFVGALKVHDRLIKTQDLCWTKLDAALPYAFGSAC